MHSGLQLVLILLAAAVLVAAVARALRLPTMLGYLVTGIIIGPFTPGFVADQALAMDKVKTKEVARATDDYVHEHPWRAVGTAAGIGLVIGLLISRR